MLPLKANLQLDLPSFEPALNHYSFLFHEHYSYKCWFHRAIEIAWLDGFLLHVINFCS